MVARRLLAGTKIALVVQIDAVRDGVKSARLPARLGESAMIASILSPNA
jgi:hypothetical protein